MGSSLDESGRSAPDGADVRGWAEIPREEEMYVAQCPAVGTVSQGETPEEAVDNLKEATELYLEEFPLEEKKRPFITTFEVVSVVKA